MIKVLFLERVLSFENSFNNFLYFLSQIPFIGKLINEDTYERNVPKKILAFVNFVLSVILDFAGKVLYSTLFFLIPYLIMKNFVMGNHFSYENSIINIFIMMNCICGSLISTAVFSDSDEDYMLVHVMRINPVRHYRGKLFFRLLADVGFFFLILLAFGIDWETSLKLSGMLLASRGIGEALRLFIYDKLPWLFEHLTFFDVCVILVSMYFAYVSPCYKGYMPGLDALALESHVYSMVMLLGLACIIMVWYYPKFELLAKRNVRYTDMKHQEQVTTRARIRAAKTETVKEYYVGKHDKKKGFAYLNALFFERCGNLAKSQVLGRVYCIIILTAIGCVWLYGADTAARYAFWKRMSEMSTWLVVIMLLASSAYKICQVLYYNCDRMLLEFSYYRKREAVKENFLCRLIRISCLDLITAIGICLAMVVLAYYADHITSVAAMWPVFAEVFALSILFSIYHTALYHMMQPYNRKLAIRVQLFRLCNGIVIGMAVLINLFPIKIMPMLVVTVILDLAALILAYRFVEEYGAKYFKNR